MEDNKLKDKQDWITVLYGVAEKMAEVALSGDTYAAGALDKILGLAMKLDGTLEESPGEKSLTSPKLLEELKLLNDQLAGKKAKRKLRPRGKSPEIRDELGRYVSSTPGGEEESLPFTDPPTPLTEPQDMN